MGQPCEKPGIELDVVAARRAGLRAVERRSATLAQHETRRRGEALWREREVVECRLETSLGKIIFLGPFKGYFDTIPKELEEAAVMEGAGPGKIFWSIVLPLAKPAIAITALFSFMTGWNEFIQAATFMDKKEMYTAPVGLRFFVGGFQQQWGYFAAGSIIVSIPVVLLFLYLRKYMVSGLTAGSVKG